MNIKQHIIVIISVAIIPDVPVHAAYVQTILADNPSAYYRLDEVSGSIASDSSGNGQLGTFYNVTLGQLGAVPNAPTNLSASFNGTNSLVDTNYSFSGSSFTIEAWINPNQATANQQLIAGFSLGPQLNYNMADNPGVVGINMSNGTGFQWTSTTTQLPLNSWSYLAGTWDENTNTLSIYVNGALDNRQTFPGTTNQPATPNYFQIGAFDSYLHGTPYNAQYFGGGIDEVAVYSQALSATTIQNHYASAAVPIPAAVWLFGSALAGLGMLGKRRPHKPCA